MYYLQFIINIILIIFLYLSAYIVAIKLFYLKSSFVIYASKVVN